ncbi:hypothetical protein G6F60_015571 [Rhizopus arrhizus]|nr:hypothetical protein G6F60_015571 [Rhizopus arrhizus]
MRKIRAGNGNVAPEGAHRCIDRGPTHERSVMVAGRQAAISGHHVAQAAPDDTFKNVLSAAPACRRHSTPERHRVPHGARAQ